jgi:hypothetical protein
MKQPSRSTAKQLHSHSHFQFVKKRQISELTGLSSDTLKKYRLSRLLIEDIHWVRVNAKLVLYNVPLIMDWLQNISDPQAHRRAIEAYQATLLSSKGKRRNSFKG